MVSAAPPPVNRTSRALRPQRGRRIHGTLRPVTVPINSNLSGSWSVVYSTPTQIQIGFSEYVTGSISRTWTNGVAYGGSYNVNPTQDAIACFQLEARAFEEVILKEELIVRYLKPGRPPYEGNPVVSQSTPSIIGYTGEKSYAVYKMRAI